MTYYRQYVCIENKTNKRIPAHILKIKFILDILTG